MELRDEEIALREWRPDDAEAVYAACQDQELLYWIPCIPRPYTREDAEMFVTGALDYVDPHRFAVTDGATVVGSIGMSDNRRGTGHIGYWCARDARRRGVTTRAVRLLCRYALEDLGMERLELVTDPDNTASQRVAEKVGFQREGVLRSHVVHPDGRRRDSIMFSLLSGELR